MREGLHAFSGLMTDITRPVLKKRGFLNASLLQHWANVVGEEMSQNVSPEKITYGKNGATLHLKVTSGAFAVMVEHRKKIILERIAVFNGHGGITDIRVSQGKKTSEKQIKEERKEIFLSQEQEKDLEKKISGIENENLRETLLSLGKSILLK